MENKKKKRREELAIKILEMGNALHNEGLENEDMIVEGVGGIIAMISGLLYDEKDVMFFSEICAMFSAKKLIEAKQNLGTSDMGMSDIDNIINKLKDDLNKRKGSDEDAEGDEGDEGDYDF